MSEGHSSLDLRAEIARIDRDRAEAHKLEIEARKLDDERRLYLDRQLVERHTENGQRHHGFAAHRVDVGNGVRRGDPAEVPRIVDHRHKKIGRRDNAVLVIDLPYRGIVSRFGTDEKLRERPGGRLFG